MSFQIQKSLGHLGVCMAHAKLTTSKKQARTTSKDDAALHEAAGILPTSHLACARLYRKAPGLNIGAWLRSQLYLTPVFTRCKACDGVPMQL